MIKIKESYNSKGPFAEHYNPHINLFKQSQASQSYSSAAWTPQTASQATSLTLLYGQINSAVVILKEKTISLISELRKYSIQPSLEIQIESYMTDVLDQMDLILESKRACQETSFINHSQESQSTFEQLPKPIGDDQSTHLEQTLREGIRIPLETIEEASKEGTQVGLSKKLQSILCEIQSENNSFVSESECQIENARSSIRVQHSKQTQRCPNENHLLVEQRAHKFSNNYIREKNRPKKGRFF